MAETNFPNGISTSSIIEATAAAGVTLDGVQLKDGAVKRTPVNVSANGAIAVPPGDTVYVITKAGVAAMTIVDPTAGTDDGKVLTFISATANAHTLSNGAGSGFNSAGAAGDIGTFGGAIGDGLQITAWNGKWLVNYLRNVTLA